jgi:hypothetical protein
MPVIIEGYNYDIFISHRQKDKKGDHLGKEFAEALKTDLESTFNKEKINFFICLVLAILKLLFKIKQTIISSQFFFVSTVNFEFEW